MPAGTGPIVAATPVHGAGGGAAIASTPAPTEPNSGDYSGGGAAAGLMGAGGAGAGGESGAPARRSSVASRGMAARLASDGIYVSAHREDHAAPGSESDTGDSASEGEETGGGAKDLLLNGRRASVRAGTLRRGKAAQQEGSHKAPVIVDGGYVRGAGKSTVHGPPEEPQDGNPGPVSQFLVERQRRRSSGGGGSLGAGADPGVGRACGPLVSRSSSGGSGGPDKVVDVRDADSVGPDDDALASSGHRPMRRTPHQPRATSRTGQRKQQRKGRSPRARLLAAGTSSSSQHPLLHPDNDSDLEASRGMGRAGPNRRSRSPTLGRYASGGAAALEVVVVEGEGEGGRHGTPTVGSAAGHRGSSRSRSRSPRASSATPSRVLRAQAVSDRGLLPPQQQGLGLDNGEREDGVGVAYSSDSSNGSLVLPPGAAIVTGAANILASRRVTALRRRGPSKGKGKPGKGAGKGRGREGSHHFDDDSSDVMTMASEPSVAECPTPPATDVHPSGYGRPVVYGTGSFAGVGAMGGAVGYPAPMMAPYPGAGAPMMVVHTGPAGQPMVQVVVVPQFEPSNHAAQGLEF